VNETKQEHVLVLKFQ